jgi:hypothetical protein
MVQGNIHGYEETPGIRNLDYLFHTAQKAFKNFLLNPFPNLRSVERSQVPSNFYGVGVDEPN